jgi:hypothetical protein
MNPYLYDTGWKFNIVRLRADITEILKQYPIPGTDVAFQGDNYRCNRISLVHEPGNPDPIYAGRQLFTYTCGEKNENLVEHESESIFTEFNQEFKHMYVYEVYKEMQCRLNNIGRVRLIRLNPGQQYPWHKDDKTVRYHIAIKTNPKCFMYVQEPYAKYQIPANGSVWSLDTSISHKAENLGNTSRYHLVFGTLGDNQS